MLITVQQIGLAVGFAVTDGDYYLYTGRHILIRRKPKRVQICGFGCLLVIFGGILLGYMKAA